MVQRVMWHVYLTTFNDITKPVCLLPPSGRARLAPARQHLLVRTFPPLLALVPGYPALDIYLHAGHWQRALQTVLPILLGMCVEERVVHLHRRNRITPVLALKAAASRSLGSGVQAPGNPQ